MGAIWSNYSTLHIPSNSQPQLVELASHALEGAESSYMPDNQRPGDSPGLVSYPLQPHQVFSTPVVGQVGFLGDRQCAQQHMARGPQGDELQYGLIMLYWISPPQLVLPDHSVLAYRALLAEI